MRAILNIDGTIKKGVAEPKISKKELLKMYETMVQVRLFDQKGMRLQRQGRIGFHIPTTGEETHVAVAAVLNDNDWIFPSYRQHGCFLWRGTKFEDYVNHLFGNELDPQLGRRLPGLYGDIEKRFVNPSAPIGTQVVQAAGVAYASKYKKDGSICAVFFGDGATSSNDFHSGVNFGAVTKSPVIFICMNNQFAISVPLEKQTAADKIIDKAIGYGLPGDRIDGNDILAMYTAVTEAADRARNGEGPTFIEALTYRLGPHTSSDDPTRYREDKEVRAWEKKDPIIRYKNYLILKGIITEEGDKKLWDKYDKLFNELIAEADKKGPPDIETMFTEVYEEMPWNLKEQLEEVKSFKKV
ncbi:MAG: Pyruvate dehydrogenase E1 component subunit alpha [Candidatus Heimdallarchaeota archaeon LC_2]|nr:MAG: Pyruvate dehydrogenase E1 component subunit alpha [Candidatus Heimdallarchaeota archaeon LC_2]